MIGIEGEKDPMLIDVFQSIIEKSKSHDLLKNPFKINAKIYKSNKLFFLMDITPIYPPVFWFGFILLIPFLIFQWFNFFLIIPLLFICLGFLWSSTFYLIILKASIKKQGYKGKLIVLSKKEIIRRLAKWHK